MPFTLSDGGWAGGAGRASIGNTRESIWTAPESFWTAVPEAVFALAASSTSIGMSSSSDSVVEPEPGERMIARGSAVEKSFAGEPDESGSKYSGKAVDEFVRARTEAAPD